MIEHQQPEGELVECPVSKGCEWATGMGCTEGCLFVRGREAQYTHDKARMVSPELVHELRVEIAELADKAQNIKDAMATMVKLPSEDELALWLCDHLNYTSREVAQVLRERLEVKP
jgi:DNA-directed RNA polymerase specialized sigma24 family protein